MTRLLALPLALAACGAPAAPAPALSHRAPAGEAALDLSSFWDTRKQPSDDPLCKTDAMGAILARPAEPPLVRADAWARLVATCRIAWNRDDFVTMRALLDFGTALLGAGYPNDCIGEIAPMATPYYGGLRADGDPKLEPIESEVDDLLGRCVAAHEKKLAAFAAPRCPGAECVELVDDADPPRPDPDDGMPHCRGVALGGVRLTVEGGPLVEDFCCGIEDLTTTVRGAVRFVRARSETYTRVCGGGTASATPDAVYKVEGGKLVLARDFTVGWH